MPSSSASPTGTLYVVATPIGNMQDITLRAKAILQSVSLVAAEDTRHAKPLLKALGLDKPMMAYHGHNEDKASQRSLEILKQGEDVALISDAGTPLIRDPGRYLVQLAHQHGIQVVPIPGACALIAALSAAGVPTDVFTFGGFLPTTTTQRQKAIQAFIGLKHTIVLYESTHRLHQTLDDMSVVMSGAAQLVLAKELTKAFEVIRHGSIRSHQTWLAEDVSRIKGEFVLIIPHHDVPQEEQGLSEEVMHCLKTLLGALGLKQAVKLTAEIMGVKKNKVYQAALMLTKP